MLVCEVMRAVTYWLSAAARPALHTCRKEESE